MTGHTGFTGGWLALWLRAIGCEVTGLALPPVTTPNLFSAAGIDRDLISEIGDIRDFAVVKRAFNQARPAVVFHLAAQPLVGRSYSEPLETFAANVMGTANVLEAARLSPSVKAVVCVTTDKVYAGANQQGGHRETDPLGGQDPYSASKACAELVAKCYRDTMAVRGNGVLIATARGGNIIGGGDWSENRIVPDFVRAVASSTPLVLRDPTAVRPWQHVLALVHGYLVLAGRLLGNDAAYADAWNFGPPDDSVIPVKAVVETLSAAWKRPELEYGPGGFPEKHLLLLDSARSREGLGWRPPLNFGDSVRLTAEWYRDYYADPSSARGLTMAQIDDYRQQLRAMP